ncbi:MBL fold metallo-hydrolase [Pseudomonas sp. 1121_17]|uniref:MBL fold metallo-hydrolase n=1 Tax=Pseudomonas sp. 1121_17 TaxID=2604458 RepID=UPI004063AE74
MEINLQPPAVNEIEISLFGPGTGECVVAHLGNNEWMIVDSCTAYRKPQPIALKYLSDLGVDPENVKLIVITHFHDDHTGGMVALIEACVKAEIYISGALTNDESIAFVMAHALGDVLADLGKPSTFEIANILKAVGERHVRCVQENQVLYRKNGIEVNALSPSSRAVTQSRASFASKFVATGVDFRKLANRLQPNLCAIALHVCNGTDTILLGSDLEVSNDPALGWTAVLNNVTRPTSTAALFKVPHHGSHNGHCPHVVAQMLKATPISILTTFNRSSLPRLDDIERIKAYSSKLFHTTIPKAKVHPPARERVAEESLAAVAKSRRVVTGHIGHIQVRMANGVCEVTHNEHASAAA